MKNQTASLAVSTVIFSAINLIYLAFHFSTVGCFFVAATVGYYLLRINYRGRERVFSAWIGAYLGAFFVDALLVYASWQELWTQEIRFYVESQKLAAAIGLLILAFFLLLPAKRSQKMNLIASVLYRYIVLFGITAGISALFISWEFLPIFCVGFFFGAIFILTEFVAGGLYIRANIVGFSWLVLLFTLFNICNALYGDFSVQLISRLFYYSAGEPVRWYILFTVLLLFLVGAVLSYLLRASGRAHRTDSGVYIALISGIAMIWMIQTFSTAYDYIFFILALVLHAVFLVSFSDHDVMLFGNSFSLKNLLYAGTSLLCLLLPIAFFFGELLPFVCFAALAVGVAGFYVKGFFGKTEENDEAEKALPAHFRLGIWQYTVTVFFALSIALTYEKCNFRGGFMLSAAVYLLSVAALLLIEIKNKLFPINPKWIRMAISLFAILFFLLSANRSGVRVSYTADREPASYQAAVDLFDESGLIRVTLQNKEKGKHYTEIEHAFMYWSDHPEDMIEIDKKTLSADIEFRNGILCVVCEKAGDIVWSDRRCFFSRAYAEEEQPAGTVRQEVDPYPERFSDPVRRIPEIENE